MKTPVSIGLRLLLLCVFGAQLVASAAETNTAQNLYLIRQKGRYGFVDRDGKVIIGPQFSEARPFKEGLARVKVDGDYGFIDVSGRVVGASRFIAADDFSEGLASVMPTNSFARWGYSDTNGSLVIAPRFECRVFEDGDLANREGRFSQGLAFVRQLEPRESGYIDKSGTFVIRGDFEEANPFSNGLAFAITSKYNRKGEYVGEKRGYIDKSGAFVISGDFEHGGRFIEGLAAVTSRGRTGFIDRTGKWVVPAKYPFSIDPFYGFSEGLIPIVIVDAQGRSGFINRAGRVELTLQFAQAEKFSEGLAPVMEGQPRHWGGNWGYINHQGEWTIAPNFTRAGLFSGGLASVEVGGKWKLSGPRATLQDSKWALIDRTGKYVWGPSE